MPKANQNRTRSGYVGKEGIRKSVKKSNSKAKSQNQKVKVKDEAESEEILNGQPLPKLIERISTEVCKELCTLLGQNLDVFAWKPTDMTGVPRSISEHCLNIQEGCPPARQKKRGQAPERNKLRAFNTSLREVEFIEQKKHDGTWQMCVDFKDLNNACPKDCYPLPEIDWKIESLCSLSNVQAPDKNHTACLSTSKLEKGQKSSDFSWTHGWPKAAFFKQMKKLIAELPMLTAPKEKEESNRYYYLAAAIKKTNQCSLNVGQGRQTSTSILCNPCSTRARDQLYSYGKAGVSLAQRKQTAEKIFPSTHNCPDFIVERPEEESPDEPMTEPEEIPKPWTLFTDRSSCIDGFGAGLILTNPEGVEFTYAMRFTFKATINEDHGSGVSDRSKQTTALEKYMKGHAICIPVLDPWLPKLSEQDVYLSQTMLMVRTNSYKECNLLAKFIARLGEPATNLSPITSSMAILQLGESNSRTLFPDKIFENLKEGTFVRLGWANLGVRVLSQIAPDFEASRARGFVLRSLELHILSFIMGIQYPNLID
ncbi:hypothetical protein Tco_0625900 [Tanacetum coccineum]|uniref:Reverse transcriptase/retrotransposon-derived protein RNase H-like domain-containing protein n=1 Tax=Tanacetum coccineum TaxID=301880 RepID=A0ABQ4WI90_9ASTR